MGLTPEQVKEWEDKNVPWKLINSSKIKPINKINNLLKNIAIILLLLIAVTFLALFALRTYYYDYFRDFTENSNICEPVTNIQPTECSDVYCSDVDVDCNCMNVTEMETLLNDICPNYINIYVNNTN